MGSGEFGSWASPCALRSAWQTWGGGGPCDSCASVCFLGGKLWGQGHPGGRQPLSPPSLLGFLLEFTGLGRNMPLACCGAFFWHLESNLSAPEQTWNSEISTGRCEGSGGLTSSPLSALVMFGLGLMYTCCVGVAGSDLECRRMGVMKSWDGR